MKLYLLVALFGAIGSLLRFFLVQITPKILFLNFPVGTLLVNLSGSLLIGIVAGLFEKNLLSIETRTFVVFGFLGGFTTFSAFTLEFFNLLKNSDYINAFVYIFISVFLSLFLFFLSYKFFKIF